MRNKSTKCGLMMAHAKMMYLYLRTHMSLMLLRIGNPRTAQGKNRHWCFPVTPASQMT